MNPWVDTWGFDLASADGYQAWRDAGGLWPDETPERLRQLAEAKQVSEQIDAELEGADHEEAA